MRLQFSVAQSGKIRYTTIEYEKIRASVPLHACPDDKQYEFPQITIAFSAEICYIYNKFVNELSNLTDERRFSHGK